MMAGTPGVEVDDRAGVRVAALAGAIDVFTAGTLPGRVLADLPADVHELVLDLQLVDFADSAGVSALVRVREQAQRRALGVRARLGADPQLNPTVLAVLRRMLDCEPD
jgi:anti-anti-sigma factor